MLVAYTCTLWCWWLIRVCCDVGDLYTHVMMLVTQLYMYVVMLMACRCYVVMLMACTSMLWFWWLIRVCCDVDGLYVYVVMLVTCTRMLWCWWLVHIYVMKLVTCSLQVCYDVGHLYMCVVMLVTCTCTCFTYDFCKAKPSCILYFRDSRFTNINFHYDYYLPLQVFLEGRWRRVGQPAGGTVPDEQPLSLPARRDWRTVCHLQQSQPLQ